MDKIQNNFDNLKYCPKCAYEMITFYDGEYKRLKCANCDYIFYFNPVAVVGCIVLKYNKILLVKRKYEPAKNKWCIPSGFMEINESPKQATIREVQEETGLEIKITNIYDVWHSNDDPRTPVIMIMYCGKIVGGSLQPGDDASECDFFCKENLPQEIAFRKHQQCISEIFSREK